MVKIPRKLIERLLKENGVKRLGRAAGDFMGKKLNTLFKEVAILASKNARDYGRKLVRKEDVEFAFSKIGFSKFA